MSPRSGGAGIERNTAIWKSFIVSHDTSIKSFQPTPNLRCLSNVYPLTQLPSLETPQSGAASRWTPGCSRWTTRSFLGWSSRSSSSTRRSSSGRGTSAAWGSWTRPSYRGKWSPSGIMDRTEVSHSLVLLFSLVVSVKICCCFRPTSFIRGTVHQSFPDFTFLTGNWIGKLMKLKGEIDPELAIDLSNKATLAFLQRHLGKDDKRSQSF